MSNIGDIRYGEVRNDTNSFTPLQGGATAGAFGGNQARALGQAGGALLEGASVMKQQQQEVNKASVRQALNNATLEAHKFYNEQVLTKKGQDGADIEGFVNDNLGKIIASHASSLQSPEQQRMYNEMVDSQVRLPYASHALDHQFEQQQVFKTQTYHAENANAIAKATSFPGDESQLAHSKFTILQNTAAEAAMNGIHPTDPAFEVLQRQANQSLFSTAFDGIVAKSPSSALDFLTKHKNEFDQTWYQDKLAALPHMIVQEKALGLSKTAVAIAKSKEDALQLVTNASTDPAVTAAAQDHVDTLFDAKQQGIDENSRKTVAGLVDQATSNPTNFVVPTDGSVTADQAEALRKIQGISAATTKPTLRELSPDANVAAYGLIQDEGRLANTSSDQFLKTYTALADTEWGKLYKEAWIKARNGSTVEAKNLRSRAVIAHDAIEGMPSLVINKAKDNEDTVSAKNVAISVFNDAFNKKVNALPATERTEENMSAIAKDMTSPVYIEGRHLTGRWFTNKTAPKYLVEADPSLFKEVPPALLHSGAGVLPNTQGDKTIFTKRVGDQVLYWDAKGNPITDPSKKPSTPTPPTTPDFGINASPKATAVTPDAVAPKDAPAKNDSTPVAPGSTVDQILQTNSHKVFVDRILHPEKYPVRNNPDGSVSTHLMASAEVDGKNIAYPTLVFNKKDNSLYKPADPIKYAMQNGEYIEFKTQKEADAFASGGYKEGIPAGAPGAKKGPDGVKASVNPSPLLDAPTKDFGQHVGDFIISQENSDGNVRALPKNDGGGNAEIFGINAKYDRQAYNHLISLPVSERRSYAADYVASVTAPVKTWGVTNNGVELFLRDTYFNRGGTGATKILQEALGQDITGVMDSHTRAALRDAQKDPKNLISDLRCARENYERREVGVRGNLWNGLVNRWDAVTKEAEKNA